jgi:hypothetical protein
MRRLKTVMFHFIKCESKIFKFRDHCKLNVNYPKAFNLECSKYTFQISSDHPDWLSCPGQEVRDLSISQPFKLDSACGTPEFTTYTIGFKDCLDYIFYQVNMFCHSLSHSLPNSVPLFVTYPSK